MDQLANTVIDRLGGTSAVAKICDIKPPSVHGWRESGIPKARLQFLRIAYPKAFEDLPPGVESSAEQAAA
ncbi:hypothetical protein ACEQ38_16965 [Ralstonia syzygii subsp. celebesensis]|uniref:Rha family transcriptional regulator n=2 Tax=Ralstonia syzygii subsp. celebesensis TaxID=1310168 RepID=A0A1U9VPX9_9RALS|nr:hypothetical protein [Ralstonia syzygii]AQW32699.1 hypothetical protein B0B51_23250 [blood disease bacterium A2-HR MARDI]QQV57717.1 hypothetical protein JK151_19925 [Ralstonia syzygii subsp. celebesensis]CCA83763.1 conserved hypothetical protein [blood disease bacterium R229]